jgi:hypothetical protein
MLASGRSPYAGGPLCRLPQELLPLSINSSLHDILAFRAGETSSRSSVQKGEVSMRQRVSHDEDREVPACSGQDVGVGHSFDHLARSLAEGNLSRRRALRLFGAALVGMMMASIPGVAWAAPCRPGQFQCGRRCCPETFSCVRGECVCLAGQQHCPAGTLQGPESCCQEGFDCCTVGAGGVIVSSTCCPSGTCRCDPVANVCTCATV